MKKRTIAWILTVALCVSLTVPVSAASYVEIGDEAGLYWFAAQVNGGNTDLNVRLTADITVNTGKLTEYDGTSAQNWKPWVPIGSSTVPYTGIFDGQGHTVSGLYFNDTLVNYAGLFGYSSGIVSDITVDNSWFSGLMNVGGICGYNKGRIENCTFSGTIGGSADSVGGICGAQNKGVITGCTNAGTVTGADDVGGICGSSTGAVVQSRNRGTVQGIRKVGGICGYSYGLLQYCGNEGPVSAADISTASTSSMVGGICGSGNAAACINSGSVTLTDRKRSSRETGCAGGICGNGDAEACANTGNVTASSVGATVSLAGISGDGDVKNCYNTGSVHAAVSSAAVYMYASGIGCSGNAENCYTTGSVSGSMSSTRIYLDAVHLRRSGTVANAYYLAGYGTSTSGKAVTDADLCALAGQLGSAFVPQESGYPALRWQAEKSNAAPVLNSSAVQNKTLLVGQPCAVNLAAMFVDPDGDPLTYSLRTEQGETAVSPVYTFTPQSEGAHTLVFTACDGSAVSETYTVNVTAKPLSVEQPELTDGYFEIGDAEALYRFAALVNGGLTNLNGKLTADIVVANDAPQWTPIGREAGYVGTFNGQGHSIRGLHLMTTEFYSGLFATNSGVIENVGVEDSELCGGLWSGGICGSNYGTIRNCWNAAAVIADASYGGDAGGICGVNRGTVTGCCNTGVIVSSSAAGGICGYNTYGVVTNCYNTAPVGGESKYSGGICGQDGGGRTANCYNTGRIGAASVGLSAQESFRGGICGNGEDCTYTNCYYLDSCGAGGSYGTAVTAEAVRELAGTLGEAFAMDTALVNSGYPVLTWQAIPVTVLRDGDVLRLTVDASWIRKTGATLILAAGYDEKGRMQSCDRRDLTGTTAAPELPVGEETAVWRIFLLDSSCCPVAEVLKGAVAR